MKMPTCFYTILEQPMEGFDACAASGWALARVVEAHVAFLPLLDFCAVDPREIALAVGMVYPYEEDGAEDLDDIDFGPTEWHEPSLGLAAVQNALRAVQAEPGSLAEAIYDPDLRPADVIGDLEAIAQALLLARQHETRFHFTMEA